MRKKYANYNSPGETACCLVRDGSVRDCSSWGKWRSEWRCTGVAVGSGKTHNGTQTQLQVTWLDTNSGLLNIVHRTTEFGKWFPLP